MSLRVSLANSQFRLPPVIETNRDNVISIEGIDKLSIRKAQVSESDMDELVERLGEAGCDDALIGTGQSGRQDVIAGSILVQTADFKHSQKLHRTISRVESQFNPKPSLARDYLALPGSVHAYPWLRQACLLYTSDAADDNRLV